jgi:hypothetical protein
MAWFIWGRDDHMEMQDSSEEEISVCGLKLVCHGICCA